MGGFNARALGRARVLEVEEGEELGRQPQFVELGDELGWRVLDHCRELHHAVISIEQRRDVG